MNQSNKALRGQLAEVLDLPVGDHAIDNVLALIDKRERLARIEELKKVGCCDYWEEGCSLNVCNGDQLARILELEALSDKHSSKDYV